MVHHGRESRTRHRTASCRRRKNVVLVVRLSPRKHCVLVYFHSEMCLNMGELRQKIRAGVFLGSVFLFMSFPLSSLQGRGSVVMCIKCMTPGSRHTGLSGLFRGQDTTECQASTGKRQTIEILQERTMTFVLVWSVCNFRRAVWRQH